MDPARIFVVVYCLLETHPLVIFCHLVKGTIQRDEENVGKNLATIHNSLKLDVGFEI